MGEDCNNSILLQWDIYDAYVEELQKQETNKEKQKAVASKKDNDKGKKKTLLMETQVHCAYQTSCLS